MCSDGNIHFYRLQAENLRQISKGLLSSEKILELVPMEEMKEDAWEQRMLKDFLNGQQLKKIPASRKKRSIISRWLAQQFAPDTRYTEAEVNAIIQRHHPDSATLRRELIGEHHMQREQGIYWRSSEKEQQALTDHEATS